MDQNQELIAYLRQQLDESQQQVRKLRDLIPAGEEAVGVYLNGTLIATFKYSGDAYRWTESQYVRYTIKPVERK